MCWKKLNKNEEIEKIIFGIVNEKAKKSQIAYND